MTTTDPTTVPSTAPQPAPLDLDLIEARCDAATPGPWRAGTTGPRDGDHWYAADQNGQAVAHIHSDDGRNEAARRPDARFIAAARADVPALVAEVRRLRAELDAAGAIGEKLRRALVGQHEAAGHALDVHAFGEDCLPCQSAADEFDGDKACDRWRAWQAEYEAAVGLPLSTVPPAGTEGGRDG